MATSNDVLHVTVLHAAAADLLWQHRQRLSSVFRCSMLRLTVLMPLHIDSPAIEIRWRRPPD
jgi:hypothetical protein